MLILSMSIILTMTDESEPKNLPNQDNLESEISSDEDDVVEFVFNDDGEEDIKATLKKLRKDLKVAKSKEMEYLTAWQRERADFQNFKKQEAEHSSMMGSYARERFIEELFPVLDAYDMAFANKEAWEKVDKNWRVGVEYIHQQLLKVLSENGVEEVKADVGDVANANLHEPMDTLSTDDRSKDHTVAQVMQKGYKTKDRVVRPARVKIFEYKE